MNRKGFVLEAVSKVNLTLIVRINMIFADFYLAEIQNSVNLKKHNNQCQKIILSLSRQPQSNSRFSASCALLNSLKINLELSLLFSTNKIILRKNGQDNTKLRVTIQQRCFLREIFNFFPPFQESCGSLKFKSWIK